MGEPALVPVVGVVELEQSTREPCEEQTVSQDSRSMIKDEPFVCCLKIFLTTRRIWRKRLIASDRNIDKRTTDKDWGKQQLKTSI